MSISPAVVLIITRPFVGRAIEVDGKLYLSSLPVLDNRPFGLRLGSSTSEVGHNVAKSPQKFFKGSSPSCILSVFSLWIPKLKPYNPLSVETMFLGLFKSQETTREIGAIRDGREKNGPDKVCTAKLFHGGYWSAIFYVEQLLRTLNLNSPAPSAHKLAPLTLHAQISPSSPDFSLASVSSALLTPTDLSSLWTSLSLLAFHLVRKQLTCKISGKLDPKPSCLPRSSRLFKPYSYPTWC